MIRLGQFHSFCLQPVCSLAILWCAFNSMALQIPLSPSSCSVIKENFLGKVRCIISLYILGWPKNSGFSIKILQKISHKMTNPIFHGEDASNVTVCRQVQEGERLLNQMFAKLSTNFHPGTLFQIVIAILLWRCESYCNEILQFFYAHRNRLV